MELFEAILGENSLGVHTEDVRALHFSVDRSVHHDFLHHFLLAGVAITFSDKVSVLDPGVRLTSSILTASGSLGVTEVRSAFFGDEVSVFGEESVEEGPASIAALIHVVASHEVLGGKQGHVLSVLDLKAGLNNLSE